MTGTNFNSGGGTQANNVNNGSGSQNNNNGSGTQNNLTGPKATFNNNNNNDDDDDDDDDDRGGKSSPGGSQGRNNEQDDGPGYRHGNGFVREDRLGYHRCLICGATTLTDIGMSFHIKLAHGR
ncbi:hypothetical protein AbraIFM66950_005157 [Aspergillus brasiliensis]|nr:hypothetical protein AbraIFM66950_005157 [Aspergillus brasiliensis]